MVIADGNLNNSILTFISHDEVVFNACVETVKHRNKFSFVYLRTKDTIYKTVCREGICRADIKTVKVGDYLKVYGIVKEEIRSKAGFEINITDFKILSTASAIPSFKTSDLSIEDTQKNRAFTIRDEKIRSIFKFQNIITKAFICFFEKNGFENVNVPMLVTASEKSSFTVDYFGENIYLPYSHHTYMAMATAAFDKTYAIAHSFSSKQHTSSRHLNEFTSLNFQAGYIQSVYDIINILTAFIIFLSDFIKKTADDVLNILDFQMPLSDTIPVFSFYEALRILNKDYQEDVDPTDIKKLCVYTKDTYNSDFAFITDFPKEKRPFYAIDNDDNKTAQSFDLYFKGQKIATGSKNITDFNVQKDKMLKLNIDTSNYLPYLDTLMYGIMPYGSAMIGLERFTMQFLGLSNIREASLFMRDLHHFCP